MESPYESLWWKAKVPEDWDTDEDDVCVTFRPQGLSAAIQVSAVIKEGTPVTDADLREFAGQRIAYRRPKTIKTAKFGGIHIAYFDNGNFWREWWLRSGNLMLYVTYNIERNLKDADSATIDQFICDLEPLSE